MFRGVVWWLFAPAPFPHDVFVDSRLFFQFIFSAMLGELLLSKCLQSFSFHRCASAFLLRLIEILTSPCDFLSCLSESSINSGQVTHRVRQCYRVESPTLKTLYVSSVSEFLKYVRFVTSSFIELVLRGQLAHFGLLLPLSAVAKDAFKAKIELFGHSQDCG